MKNKHVLTANETVPLSRTRAFDVFVNQFSSWYPRAYTWSREKLVTIELGAAEGALCVERGPHNFRLDWGRMLTYQPPERIVFTWQINYNRQPVPDPEKASEVEVKFMASDQQDTTIELQHRKFNRHEENGQQYRDALASPEGWPFILNRFKAFCQSTSNP